MRPIIIPMLTACYPYFFVLVLQLTTVSRLIAQQPADVRQVRWGLTPQQVKEAESRKPTSFRNEKLVYARVPLANRILGLEYTFNGDSLLSASYYYYTTASITQADVVAASTELEALLTEKYGPGKTSQVGEIRTTNWLTLRTQISLSLGNVNKGWSLELVYLCRVCSGVAGIQAHDTSKARKDIKDL